MPVTPSLAIEILLRLLWVVPTWALFGLCCGAAAKRWHADALSARLHGLALTLALPVLLVRALGGLGAITRSGVLLGVLALSAVLASLAGRDGWTTQRRSTLHAARLLRALCASPLALSLLAALVALGSAVLCATLLAPWGWDSLGYHLPTVFDAIQSRRFGETVSHVTYVSTYPKGIEAFFVAFTLTLPDDRWVELGQVPFALGGVLTVAVLARRAGATATRALGYALAWLSVPVVFLQLAQNYVDIAHATLILLAGALVTGPLSPRGHPTTALTLALLLSSKPSAPAPFALLSLVWLVRSWKQAPTPLVPILFIVVSGFIGGEAYLLNLMQHGNPVYPVSLQLGPLRLPGHTTPAAFFGVGTPPGFATHPWLLRVLRSWATIPSRSQYIYDMRLGWHGPLWWPLLATPLALVRPRLYRGISLPLSVIALSTLATPAAFWPRFTLALPAALLSLAAVLASRLDLRRARLADGVLGLGAVLSVALAWPGLTADGPRLQALVRDPSRAHQVSADGQRAQWSAALGAIPAGRTVVYDESLELPGVLWREDRALRVRHIPSSTLASRSNDGLRHAGVSLLVIAHDGPLARRLDAAHSAPLFRCRDGACSVYRLP
jgi:hypothetical protein